MILTDEAIGQLGPSGHQHTDEGEGLRFQRRPNATLSQRPRGRKSEPWASRVEQARFMSPWPRLLWACWKVEEEELRKIERRIRYTLYALFDSDHQPASLACGDSRALRGRKERPGQADPTGLVQQIKMVAGVGFEPTTFRL